MKDRDREIIRLYVEEKKATPEIGRVCDCSTSTVVYTLKKYNIKRRNSFERTRIFSFDKTYFKQIDTQTKAYFLGLLYADGYNYKKGVTITLQEKDKEILEQLKQELKYEGRLYYKEKLRIGCSNTFQLCITSKEIAEDLNRLGCVPQKSLILRFPTENQVPKELIRHFIRGYFDGDGCVFISKQLYASFVGTFEFLFAIQEILKQELNFNFVKLHIKSKTRMTNNYQLSIGGTKKALEFLTWLYKDSTIFLNRKRDKFETFKSNYHTLKAKKESDKEIRSLKKCSTISCNNVIIAKGICNKCYQKEYYLNNKIYAQ